MYVVYFPSVFQTEKGQRPDVSRTTAETGDALVMIRFPRDVYEDLQAFAEMTGVSANDLVIQAVRTRLEAVRSLEQKKPGQI